jgi:hypothetical protein
MFAGRFIGAMLVAAFVCGSIAGAKEFVPFKGKWQGSTLSAEPTEDPKVVLVVSGGSGQATRLGRFTMVSPHFTVLSTFEVFGEQIFTAANGDTLTAEISGQFQPTPDGALEATLEGTIIGGTGRFAGASGSYDFHIIARPAAFGFDSTATFTGTISSVGASD